MLLQDLSKEVTDDETPVESLSSSAFVVFSPFFANERKRERREGSAGDSRQWREGVQDKLGSPSLGRGLTPSGGGISPSFVLGWITDLQGEKEKKISKGWISSSGGRDGEFLLQVCV